MAKLVECIPNFSVSRQRDPAVFRGLEETARSVPGCMVLDIQSDGDHDRCVFTLVGGPEAIAEAAFRLAERAVATIDMTRHHGQHPRMGAVDVIPFVPTMDVTLEECVDLSKTVSRRVWEELGLPVFLYEASAGCEARRDLAAVRRGQFEGMPEKLLRPEWAPDYGERRIHPTAGVVAIGARMPLIAYNVELDTGDLEVAQRIARAIRGSSGGFRYCKAIGVELADRGVAQVSMNLVDYQRTPIYVVFETIRVLAERYGARITRSELVGLAPAKALLDCAEHYLKLDGFDGRQQVMEYHLIGME